MDEPRFISRDRVVLDESSLSCSSCGDTARCEWVSSIRERPLPRESRYAVSPAQVDLQYECYRERNCECNKTTCREMAEIYLEIMQWVRDPDHNKKPKAAGTRLSWYETWCPTCGLPNFCGIIQLSDERVLRRYKCCWCWARKYRPKCDRGRRMPSRDFDEVLGDDGT